MKYFGLFLIMIGAGIYSYSTTLKPYSNEEEFNKKYHEIQLEDDDKSEHYQKLRDKYLTDKYTYEDYGLTFIFAGLCIFIILLKGWENMTSPKNKWTIRIIGLTAVFANTLGYIYSLLQESDRGSYPWWADSIVIVIPGIPIVFLAALLWYGINSMSLKAEFHTGVKLNSLLLSKLNKWISLLLLATIGFTFYSIVTGDFLITIYGFLWGYFYLCLLAGRSSSTITPIEK
jgi:hypothetical protein